MVSERAAQAGRRGTVMARRLIVRKSVWLGHSAEFRTRWRDMAALNFTGNRCASRSR